MTSFIQFTAKALYDKHGEDLRNYLLLFPNRRSILFFRKALVEAAGKPVWAPEMHTFDSWIKNNSGYETPDELALILRLYQSWQEVGGTERFEAFYTLGQMLLRDFDNIDESMLDKDRFFLDLSNLHNWDLEEIIDMEPALKDLAKALKNKEITVPISNIWKRFGRLYKSFAASLEKDGLATPGMIYHRMATKGMSEFTHSLEGVYTIGLYKLSTSEIKILDSLSQVHYFWNSMSPEVSSTLDWSHPLQKFIDQKSHRSTVFLNSIQNKHIEIIGAAGQQQQLQGMAYILEDMAVAQMENTAILLSEQSLLLPLLQVVPDRVQELNVSMGLSVLDTPIYSLVQRFILCLDGWKNGRYIKSETVLLLLDHDLLKNVKNSLPSELTKPEAPLYWHLHREWENMPGVWRELLSPCPDQKTLLAKCLKFLEMVYETATAELDRAAIYHLFLRLQRLSTVLADVEDDWAPTFFANLLRRILQHSNITLRGEPLKGLQVLGAQEMVNLHFDHLIMMDVNEGVMPRAYYQSTIPITLAQIYKLPGVHDLVAGQEHLFWTSIDLASKVTIFYNTTSQGISKADPSRWLQRVFMGLHPEHWQVTRSQVNAYSYKNDGRPISIPLSEENLPLVKEWMNEGNISPSAINTWLSCRLKFFMQYILKYREKEEKSDDLDSAHFGSILHNTLEKFYQPFEGREINLEEFDFERKKIGGILIQEYCLQFRIPEDITREGSHSLFIEMLEISIDRILKLDRQNLPFQVIKVEDELTKVIRHGENSHHFLGKVDRLDLKAGTPRIIDYKTGSLAPYTLKANYIDIWKRDGKSKKEAFQTLFYAWLYNQISPTDEIPETYLYFSRGMKSVKDARVLIDKSPDVTSELLETFQGDLFDQLEEIMDPQVTFDQTSNVSICAYCPYKDMCNR